MFLWFLKPDNLFEANDLFDSWILVVLLDSLDGNGWEGSKPEGIGLSGDLTPKTIPLYPISTLQFVIDAPKLTSHKFTFLVMLEILQI